MRDLRAVIHGITTAVLCGVAVFSCSTISKAAGETYQTAVEAAYGDTFRGVYENYLAGSPLEAENLNGNDSGKRKSLGQSEVVRCGKERGTAGGRKDRGSEIKKT